MNLLTALRKTFDVQEARETVGCEFQCSSRKNSHCIVLEDQN